MKKLRVFALVFVLFVLTATLTSATSVVVNGTFDGSTGWTGTGTISFYAATSQCPGGAGNENCVHLSQGQYLQQSITWSGGSSTAQILGRSTSSNTCMWLGISDEAGGLGQYFNVTTGTAWYSYNFNVGAGTIQFYFKSVPVSSSGGVCTADTGTMTLDYAQMEGVVATATPTNTPTITPTATPSPTPTSTTTPFPTDTPTITPSPIPTNTPTPTNTTTPLPTSTRTSTPTATNTVPAPAATATSAIGNVFRDVQTPGVMTLDQQIARFIKQQWVILLGALMIGFAMIEEFVKAGEKTVKNTVVVVTKRMQDKDGGSIMVSKKFQGREGLDYVKKHGVEEKQDDQDGDDDDDSNGPYGNAWDNLGMRPRRPSDDPGGWAE